MLQRIGDIIFCELLLYVATRILEARIMGMPAATLLAAGPAPIPLPEQEVNWQTYVRGGALDRRKPTAIPALLVKHLRSL